MKPSEDGKSAPTLDGWWIVLCGVVTSMLLIAFTPTRVPDAGSELTVDLTVVPRDRDTLSCDSGATIGGHRCTHADGKPVPSVERPLRPYVTTGRELVLLSGVFESPDVAQWVERSRGTGRNDRATLRCRIQMVAQSVSVGVRFGATGAFSRERPGMVGRVVECRVK